MDGDSFVFKFFSIIAGARMKSQITRVSSRQVVIINELGLHARSAAGIAKIAGHAESKVQIVKGEDAADARDILDILSLGCPKGTAITIRIDNPSDMAILDRIAAFVEDGFGE